MASKLSSSSDADEEKSYEESNARNPKIGNKKSLIAAVLTSVAVVAVVVCAVLTLNFSKSAQPPAQSFANLMDGKNGRVLLEVRYTFVRAPNSTTCHIFFMGRPLGWSPPWIRVFLFDSLSV
jgi:hypothetical protein